MTYTVWTGTDWYLGTLLLSSLSQFCSRIFAEFTSYIFSEFCLCIFTTKGTDCNSKTLVLILSMIWSDLVSGKCDFMWRVRVSLMAYTASQSWQANLFPECFLVMCVFSRASVVKRTCREKNCKLVKIRRHKILQSFNQSMYFAARILPIVRSIIRREWRKPLSWQLPLSFD